MSVLEDRLRSNMRSIRFGLPARRSSMIEEVKAALAIAIQVGQPTLLWGAPGEGKTSIVEEVGSSLRRPVEVVIGSLREASDFVGIPMRTDAGVCFAPPALSLIH